MQYIFLSFISIPFLYLNYKIIISDIKEKIIPNKYLMYLLFTLPFFYTYLIYYNFNLDFLSFFIHIIFTFFISFILYSFGVWSAGDAKYLLVLSLFIPYIGILTLIGNLAILTFGYLFLYFIWFYFGKCLFNWKYSKSLYINITNDLKDKLITFLKYGDGNLYIKVIVLKLLKLIFYFLIIFVGIRISRIYIIKNFNSINIFNKNHIYILLLSFTLIIIGFLLLKILYFWIKKISIKKRYFHYIDITLFLMFFLILLGFIYYEYTLNSLLLMNNLYKIFTIYLIIYFLFTILRYSYKLTFNIAETYFINIGELKIGDIIDKDFIINIVKIITPENEISIKNYNKNILLLKGINKILTNEDIQILKNIYKEINEINENNNGANNKFNKLEYVKILKNFSFAPYIFIGFIITIVFQNKLFIFLTNIITQYIKDI